MDLDLDTASKRLAASRAARQREARRQRAERTDAAEAERADAAAEAGRRDAKREAQEREAREREESNGVRYAAFLSPVPLASEESLETDRLRLPPSALAALISGAGPGAGANALDVSEGPLTFEVSLHKDGAAPASARAGAPLAVTHAGVSEFTAEEGVVVLPLKTALSLTKGGPIDFAGKRVRVRYLPTPRAPRLRAVVQPMGEGFHVRGAAAANIDLKAVMERALRSQTVLSRGDVVPLRHEGATYMLRVRELEPEPRAVLIDTDL